MKCIALTMFALVTPVAALENDASTNTYASVSPPIFFSQFDHLRDFEGWNCRKIITCGDFGQICGGCNTKGGDADIRITFTLHVGTYSVELDFIQIDFWFVRRYGVGRMG